MTREEQALLRRYGQRKRHQAALLRKSEREAEIARLNVLDAIYLESLNNRDMPYYAFAIAEQRRYESAELFMKSMQKFAKSLRETMLPAFERMTKAAVETNRAIEKARS